MTALIDVDLVIGGHSYVLSCAPEEQQSLRHLASIVDAKVAQSRMMVGGLSEVRQLLFAALLLAEDAQSQAEVTPLAGGNPLPAASTAAASQDDGAERGVAERIAAIQGRIERLTSQLSAIVAADLESGASQP